VKESLDTERGVEAPGVQPAAADPAAADPAAADPAAADPAAAEPAAGESVAAGPGTAEPGTAESAPQQAAGLRTSEAGDEAIRERRVRNVLVGALAGLLVVAVAGAVVLGQRVAAAQEEERARTEAVHAARQLVVNFTTVDHRSFDRSTKGVLALSAGDFRQQYANASKELERLVKENKTVSSGKVLYAGVVSFDPDSARVLVVADADVTNVAAKKPQLRTYRLQLDLSREPGGWRVVDLSFVG
jgi:Mce-associated membrane protein